MQEMLHELPDPAPAPNAAKAETDGELVDLHATGDIVYMDEMPNDQPAVAHPKAEFRIAKYTRSLAGKTIYEGFTRYVEINVKSKTPLTVLVPGC